MADDLKTFDRFEFKYFVPHKVVPALSEDLRPYTYPDPHGEGEWGYQVHSVYWDSPDLSAFWEKIDGQKVRRKFRLRRYGDGPGVFLEIKGRVDRSVLKRRVCWPAERVTEVFGRGDGVVNSELVDEAADPVAAEALVLCHQRRLRPTMAVSYRRKAFFGTYEPELRVNFDTRIQYSAAELDVTRPMVTGKYALDPRVVLMEVKFDERVPRWLCKLICRYDLTVIRMSKYCTAVDLEFFEGQHT